MTNIYIDSTTRRQLPCNMFLPTLLAVHTDDNVCKNTIIGTNINWALLSNMHLSWFSEALHIVYVV